MKPRMEKALIALITQPTKEEAARAAGITSKTLRDYLKDPEFQEAYKAAFAGMMDEATRSAQQSLNPALTTLREIVEDKKQSPAVRIQAARALLEYGLRLTEINDILSELDGGGN